MPCMFYIALRGVGDIRDAEGVMPSVGARLRPCLLFGFDGPNLFTFGSSYTYVNRCPRVSHGYELDGRWKRRRRRIRPF